MKTNRSTNEPAPSDRQGDMGHGHKSWTPESGEQGISNRPDDEGDTVPDAASGDDERVFGGDDDEELEDESEEGPEATKGQ